MPVETHYANKEIELTGDAKMYYSAVTMCNIQMEANMDVSVIYLPSLHGL